MNMDLFGNSTHHLSPVSVRRRESLTYRGNVKKGRHGWLRLTPAYSLHVVQEILQESSKGDLILDPFSGTGTTPLASAVLGIPAHAVDINPFLVWLGNVKLSTYESHIVDEFRLAARHVCLQSNRVEKSSQLWLPSLHQIDKWWDKEILEALAQLFANIMAFAKAQDPTITDLLKIAFCRAMIETSQVSFGHQSMSFKKRFRATQESLLYSKALSDAHVQVRHRFFGAVEEMANSLISDQPSAPAKVFLGDSRNLESALPVRHYTKIVTSPPYPNRMSYIRELRPYMYWLGYLTNGHQAGELDWQAIGGTWGCATSNLNSWEPDPEQTIPHPQFDFIIASISMNHKLLAQYVHKYFQDVKAHLQSLRRVMSLGGHCHYIVGNSKFYTTLLPAEEIYAALFENAGFMKVQIERLRKRNSKKELYEYVVSAELPPS